MSNPNTGSREMQKAVGKKIRKLRLQKGWSQKKMAEVGGLNDRYLGAIERGEIDASLSTLDKIARTLRTTVSQLFQNAATPFHGRL